MGRALAPTMRAHLKCDKKLHVIYAQICDIATQMTLPTKHVIKLCLPSSDTTDLQKKHVPLEICLCVKVVVKDNPPTIVRQRNTFARN